MKNKDLPTSSSKYPAFEKSKWNNNQTSNESVAKASMVESTPASEKGGHAYNQQNTLRKITTSSEEANEKVDFPGQTSSKQENADYPISQNIVSPELDQHVLVNQDSVDNISSSNSDTAYNIPPTGSRFYDYFLKLIGGRGKLRHVFFILIILALISSIKPSYFVYTTLLPATDNLEQKVLTIIDEVFPDELEIIIENGRASTNVTEPYYLTINKSTVENLFLIPGDQSDTPLSRIRLLTIDTRATLSDFERYQSMGLLTSEHLFYMSEGDVNFVSLSTSPDMVITKSFVVEKISEHNEGGKVTGFIRSFLYISPLLLIGVFLIYYAISIFVGSFLVFIINKILQAGAKFKDILMFYSSLFAVPAMLLILIGLLPYMNSYLFWLSTAINVVVISASYALIKLYKKLTINKQT